MPERFREWDVPESEAEPITFRLAGTDFVCVGEAPFGVLADFMQKVADGRVPLNATQDFIISVLAEGQEDLFRKVTRNTERPVHRDQVQEIVDWLIECYVARPTSPPVGSSNGRDATGDSSTDSSPEPASTPEA